MDGRKQTQLKEMSSARKEIVLEQKKDEVERLVVVWVKFCW